MNLGNSMQKQSIALVAHDNKKGELAEWAKLNKDILKNFTLLGTGTTGGLIEDETGLKVDKLMSGPLGGDQQIGAKIAEGSVGLLIFFWDPLEPMPHEPDIKALLRIAALWNIPVACNRASADYIIASPLMQSDYEAVRPQMDDYLNRQLPK